MSTFEKVKTLGPKEHSKCSPDHMLVLVTEASGVRYPMESCGKINWCLHLMEQKYGWKIDTISVYTKDNVAALLKQVEEEDARNKAIQDYGEARGKAAEAPSAQED